MDQYCLSQNRQVLSFSNGRVKGIGSGTQSDLQISLREREAMISFKCYYIVLHIRMICKIERNWR